MYFPSDINFQYFFFDTYVGYFLQALPIALLVGVIYGIVRYRRDKTTAMCKKLFSCVFICYMTGLFCLVIGLDIMGIAWYELLYPMHSGRSIRWFSGEFDFGIDLFQNIGGETIGNLIMFMPFGMIHPFTKVNPTWENTVLTGFVSVLVIEVMQPVFGRSFDLNDIIMNFLGIVTSASVFFCIKYLVSNQKKSPLGIGTIF